MGYEVRLEEVQSRRLAAAHGSTTRAELGGTILKLLDSVWAVLRAQRVPTDHNVVVYYGGLGHIEVGVEVLGDFQAQGEVREALTPAGTAVTTTHWGEYTELLGAYQALERWCATNGRRPSGTSWEVYGDWAEQPQDRRTDIYLLLA